MNFLRKQRPLKEKVSITLDGPIIERVRDEAEQVSRSFSQYINIVLSEYFEMMDKKAEEEHGKT